MTHQTNRPPPNLDVVSEQGGASLSGLRRRSPIEDADRSTREDSDTSAALLANN
jgi:hypothetical protein